MFKLTLILTILILIHCSQYLLKPLGSCLGNCRYCDKKDLQTCTGFSGSKCSLGYSQDVQTSRCVPDATHKDQIQQLNKFINKPDLSGWNLMEHQICEYQGIQNNSYKFNILGFFKQKQNIFKKFPIKVYHRSVILSFNIIHNGWQPFNDYLNVILKTNKKTLETYEISYELRDTSNKNHFKCKNQLYKLQKYQIQTVLGEHNDSQLILSFESNMGQKAKWGLTNLHLLVGCSNFIVPSNEGQCNSCQSGFFKIASSKNNTLKCQRCPGVCLTCTASNVCTSCVQGLQAYNNRCFMLQKYNKTSIGLPDNQKCGLYKFIKSNNGALNLGKVKIPVHTDVAISFSIFYDPSEWTDGSQLFVYFNRQLIHTFRKSDLKTYSIGQCSYFKSGVFQLQKLTTPYIANLTEQISLGLMAMSSGRAINFGLDSSGLHFLHYICTQHCIKCDRTNHKCLQCKEGYKVQQNKCIQKPQQPEEELQQEKQQPRQQKQQQPKKVQKKQQEPKQQQKKNQDFKQQPKEQQKKDEIKQENQQQKQPQKQEEKIEQKPVTKQTVPIPKKQSKQLLQNIKIEFHPINYVKSNNAGINVLLKYPPEYQIRSFRATIDKLPGQWLDVTNVNIKGRFQFLTILINQSFVDGIIGLYSNSTYQNQKPRQVKNQVRNLQSNQIQWQLIKKQQIQRFDYVNPQKASEIISLGYIFLIVSWVSILGTMIAIPFSCGKIFDQLILTSQLIFLHTYIYSEYLPLSLKEPLSALQRIQKLNYFLPNESQFFESIFLGNVVQDSPLRISQYYKDVNFLRGFYPILIINILFALWFTFCFIFQKMMQKVKQKNGFQEKLLQIVSKVSNRKMNYFDQIWRYQFLTLLWICLIQFYNMNFPLDANRSVFSNNFLCFLTLMITIGWPVAVNLYTIYQKRQLQRIQFTEFFCDIYFNMTVKTEFPSIFANIYIGVKYFKYGFYAIAASWIGNQPFGALLPCIALQIIQLIILFRFKVYESRILIILRIIQNTLFVLIALIMLEMSLIGNTAEENIYFSLGYFVYGLMVICLLNGVARAIVIGYAKLGGKFEFNRKLLQSHKDLYLDNPIQTNRNL